MQTSFVQRGAKRCRRQELLAEAKALNHKLEQQIHPLDEDEAAERIQRAFKGHLARHSTANMDKKMETEMEISVGGPCVCVDRPGDRSIDRSINRSIDERMDV